MTFAILTNTGRNKEAAAMANGTAFTATEMAWGDGTRIPAGGEMALENEQGRKPVQGSGTVQDTPNTAFFDVLLDEAEGPFVICEVGLFDADGDMVAVAHYDPPVNKPLDHVSALIRINILFSDLENLILKVQSTDAYVTAERVLTAGTGLTGGGDMSEDRSFAVDFATEAQARAGARTDKVMSPALVAAVIGDLLDGAPGALDTLNELAQAVQENDGEIAAALEQIAGLVSGVVRGDNVDNGTVTIRADGAHFVVSDGTNPITNYLWRNPETGRFYIGTPDAVPTLRADLISQGHKIRSGSAYIENGEIHLKEGIHRTTANDGGGNVQTRLGHKFEGGVEQFTHGGTAFYIGGDVDSPNGRLVLQVAKNGGAGIGQPVIFGDSFEVFDDDVRFRGASLLGIGMVAAFATDTPPGGWLECDGSGLSRVSYAGLYAV
ncbi:MAG: phage tail protein, partial [Marinovum sp.]|nr:phage tail protein [Marinovum sp.]